MRPRLHAWNLRICLLLALSLTVLPLASAEEAPDPPVEIITILEKDVYKLGETIHYRIELVNRLDQPIIVSPSYRSPKLVHEEKGCLEPITGPFQSIIAHEAVPPKGRIEIHDSKYTGGVGWNYPLVYEGFYTLQGASSVHLHSPDALFALRFGSPWTDRIKANSEAFRREHPLPSPIYSEPVSFRISGGEAPPEDVVNELLRPVMAGHGNLGRAYRPPGSPGFIVKAGGVTLHVNPYEPPSKYGMGKSYTMSQVEFLGLSEWGPVWARYGEALPDSWPEWRKAVMETLEIKPSDGPKLAETPKWPVELVAKLEKKKYRLDEPILYQLELINRLDEPVIVQTYNEVPRVTSDVSGDLQPRPPSESLRSTWREIAPGGSAVVRENTDLRDDALLIKPGRYTFKGASTVWLYPSELKSDFEKSGSSDDYAASEALRAKHPMPSRNYSAPVAFELKGGEPRPEDAAARRWLDRHPEKSWLIELDAPAVVGGPTVISTTIGSGLYIDLTVFHLHLGAESAPSEKDPVYLSRTYNVELLGKSAQWGPVWAQYEPKVDERWPEWREAAREVWEIAPDEAPESTP